MYENDVMVILKKSNGLNVFIREGGRISSLLTPECLFSREKAWAVSREYCEIHKENAVIVFRTLGVNYGYIGKTPDDILSAKKRALLDVCRKQKIKRERRSTNETKKKKILVRDSPDGLFSNLEQN